MSSPEGRGTTSGRGRLAVQSATSRLLPPPPLKVSKVEEGFSRTDAPRPWDFLRLAHSGPSLGSLVHPLLSRCGVEGSGAFRAAAAATAFASSSHPEDQTLPECGELGEALTCLPARSLSILPGEDRCESRRNQPGRVRRPGGHASRRRTGAGAACARAPRASPTSSARPASDKLPKLGASQS